MEFKTDTLCKMVRRISNNVKNENKMFVNIFYIIKLSNADYLLKKPKGGTSIKMICIKMRRKRKYKYKYMHTCMLFHDTNIN